MSHFRKLLGVSLGFLMLNGCQSTPSHQTGPIVLTPGSREYDLRQKQLNALSNDPGRANQNPVAVGRANPGSGAIGGIQRIPGSGGTSGASAGLPTEVNPGTTGIERRSGVGAP
jgi:hypothetical protein